MNPSRKTCGICGVPLSDEELDDGICEDCRTEPTDLEGHLAQALQAADTPTTPNHEE